MFNADPLPPTPQTPLAAAPNPALPLPQQPVPAQTIRAGDWLLHSDGRSYFRVKAVFHQPRHSYLFFHVRDPAHLRPWDEVIFVPPYRPTTHLQSV